MSLVPTCGHCGSESILNDAWATYNSETGEWELAATFDNGYCEDCDGPISSFVWVEKKSVEKKS